MERLLVLKLDAVDCEAEASPERRAARRASMRRGRAPSCRSTSTRWPARTARARDLAAAGCDAREPGAAAGSLASPTAGGWLQLRILLPRVGSMADESTARTLAQLDWAPPEGEALRGAADPDGRTSACRSASRAGAGSRRRRSKTSPTLHSQALAVVQELARTSRPAQPERFLAATRLRTEEIAVAYQRRPEDETERLRERLLALHADRRLTWRAADGRGAVPAPDRRRPPAGMPGRRRRPCADHRTRRAGHGRCRCRCG